MGARPLVVVLAGVLGVVAPRAAHASPSAKLTYVRGAGAQKCPNEAQLRQAVSARLGYDPFFPTAPKTILAEVSATPNGFRSRVAIVDDQGVTLGERSLDTKGEDCAEVVRALALAISIAVDDLDPVKPATPTPSPPATEPESVVAPVTPPPAPPAPPHAPKPLSPSPSAPLTYDIAAGGHVSLRLAPTTSAGFHLRGGLSYRAFAIGLEGTFELPASSAVSGTGRVETTTVTLAVLPCLRATIPFACALLALGSFSGGGIEIVTPRSDSAFYAAAGARLGARFTVTGPIGIVPHLDVIAPLTRHRLIIDGKTAYELESIGGSLGIDVEARFR